MKLDVYFIFSFNFILSGLIGAFIGRFYGCNCFGWVDILLVILKLGRPTWEVAVHIAAADDVGY